MAAIQPLTEQEHEAVGLTAELACLLAAIVGTGETRERDLAELLAHVHVIQSAILAQAAARLYPTAYRLLGDTLTPVLTFNGIDVVEYICDHCGQTTVPLHD